MAPNRIDPDASEAAPAAASIRRDISLPPFYDQLITARMRETGVSRSEAIRQFINEALGRGGKLARLEIRLSATGIKDLCGKARATRSSSSAELATIEAAADKILRMVTEGNI